MKKLILLLGFLISTFGCIKETEMGREDLTKPSQSQRFDSYSTEDGEVINLPNGISVIKIGDEYVWGGDIMLTEEQFQILKTNPSRSLAMSNFARYWYLGKVYYTFDSNVSTSLRQTFLAAISHWEANTCIRFFLRTNQSDYIVVKNSPKPNVSSSSLGCVGGAQELLLSIYSSTGTAIHELGHAVGLLHEHQRPDRDNYITIHNQNMDSGYSYNFNKEYGTRSIGDFDFNSIMLYNSWAFSINGNPTMTKKDGSTFWSQDYELSEGDIAGVKFIYGPPFVKIDRFEKYYMDNSGGTADIQEGKWDIYLDLYSDPECINPMLVTTSARFVNYHVTTATMDNFNGYTDSYNVVIPSGTRSYYYLAEEYFIYHADYGYTTAFHSESYSLASPGR